MVRWDSMEKNIFEAFHGGFESLGCCGHNKDEIWWDCDADDDDHEEDDDYDDDDNDDETMIITMMFNLMINAWWLTLDHWCSTIGADTY